MMRAQAAQTKTRQSPWIHALWSCSTLLVLGDLALSHPTLASRDWGPIRQFFPDLPVGGLLGYGGSLIAIWILQTVVEAFLVLSPLVGSNPRTSSGAVVLRILAFLALLGLAATVFFAVTFVG
jgi:hypothetical protein